MKAILCKTERGVPSVEKARKKKEDPHGLSLVLVRANKEGAVYAEVVGKTHSTSEEKRCGGKLGPGDSLSKEYQEYG